MQEQNFEKQVDKLLDDLVIQPSSSVWPKVEEQIRRKKDRRRIVFWLLPVLLMGIGLSYWLVSSDSREIHNNIDIPSATSKQNINSTEKILKTDHQENLLASPDKIIKKNQQLQTSNKKYSSDKSINFQVHNRDNFRNITINKVTNNIPYSSATQIIKPTVVVQKKTISNISDEQVPYKKLDSTVSEVGEKVKIIVENTIVDSPEVVQKQIENNNEVLETEKPILSNVISKWKMAPYVAAGFSNVSKGLFDPVASADFPSMPGNTTGSGSFFPPSVPEKGTYFAAGLRIVKKINTRFEISTGIQYNYFSTKQNIGTRVVSDTTISYSNTQVRVQDYYRNGNTNKYINNYHFISLPVAIEYQLINFIPLSMQAGVSLNRLVSTNALLYNSNSNIQFENDKAWNKTQLHSFSGLQFHFLKNKSFSFKAGPFIQYSFTRLEQNRKQFLSVAGFQSQFYFQYKK